VVPIAVQVELFKGDGVRVGSLAFRLAAYSHLQQNDVFYHLSEMSMSALSLASIDDAYAVLRSSTSGARYFAYASVVDNRSGNPIYIPAR
jgi:hypothetical protein